MITHINPAGLHKNPVFSQAIIAPAGRTLYIGGQDGTDPEGALVSDDAGEQTAQALTNILTILDDVGATVSDVVKMTVYLSPDADFDSAFAAVGPVWGPNPTTITVLRTAPVRPGALVEIEAIAALP